MYEFLGNRLSDNIKDIYNLENKTRVKIVIKRAADLVDYRRFDLIVKINLANLYFLTDENHNNELIEKYYEEHIRAFTLNSFHEPDGSKKNLSDYTINFKNLFYSLKNGFDSNLSLIPITNSNLIIDGSHRLAICYVLNLDVATVEIDTPGAFYNIDFFLNRRMSSFGAYDSLLKFSLLKKTMRYIIIWPRAFENDKVDKITENLVSKIKIIHKEIIYPNFQYILNLVNHCYYLQNNSKNLNHSFSDTKFKSLSVFSSGNPLEVYLVDSKLSEDLNVLKAIFRSSINYGHDSIHISDDFNDSSILNGFFLNQNSRLLNHEKLLLNTKTKNLFTKYTYLINKSKNQGDFIITGSFLLGLLGIREINDLDYISEHKLDSLILNNNKNEARYYPYEMKSVINNPKNFFYWLGVKIIAPELLITFKSNRREKKDKIDILLLKNKLPHKFKGATFKNSINLEVFYIIEKIKYDFKVYIIKLLRKFYLYNFLRFLFRKIIKDEKKL